MLSLNIHIELSSIISHDNRQHFYYNKYNVKFEHIAGKKNMVADVISHLKAVNQYEEPEDC